MGWGAFAKGFASTLDLQPAARQVSSGIQRRTARRDKLADDKRLRGERMDDAETLRDQSLEDQKAKEDRDAALYKQKTDAENQRYKDRRAAELAQGQQTFEQQEAAKAARREEDRTAESQALTKAQQEKEAKNRADYIAIKESVGEEAWNSSAYHQSIRGADSERAFSLGIISFSDYERQKTNVYKETQDDGTTLGAKFRDEDAARSRHQESFRARDAKREKDIAEVEKARAEDRLGGGPEILVDLTPPDTAALGAPRAGVRGARTAAAAPESTAVNPANLGGVETSGETLPDTLDADGNLIRPSTEEAPVPEGALPKSHEAASSAPSGDFKSWLDKQDSALSGKWHQMPPEMKDKLRKMFEAQTSGGGQAYRQMLGAPGAPA